GARADSSGVPQARVARAGAAGLACSPAARRQGEAMPEGTDVFEIMHTTRAMRRLKPDPVPDELIRRILEAGTCAANGGNFQRWRFLVIKDPAIKKAVQVW